MRRWAEAKTHKHGHQDEQHIAPWRVLTNGNMHDPRCVAHELCYTLLRHGWHALESSLGLRGHVAAKLLMIVWPNVLGMEELIGRRRAIEEGMHERLRANFC